MKPNILSSIQQSILCSVPVELVHERQLNGVVESLTAAQQTSTEESKELNWVPRAPPGARPRRSCSRSYSRTVADALSIDELGGAADTEPDVDADAEDEGYLTSYPLLVVYLAGGGNRGSNLYCSLRQG